MYHQRWWASGEHEHTHTALCPCGRVHHGPMFTGGGSRSAGMFLRLLIVSNWSFFTYWLMDSSRTISAFSEFFHPLNCRVIPDPLFASSLQGLLPRNRTGTALLEDHHWLVIICTQMCPWLLAEQELRQLLALWAIFYSYPLLCLQQCSCLRWHLSAFFCKEGQSMWDKGSSTECIHWQWLLAGAKGEMNDSETTGPKRSKSWKTVPIMVQFTKN